MSGLRETRWWWRKEGPQRRPSSDRLAHSPPFSPPRTCTRFLPPSTNPSTLGQKKEPTQSESMHDNFAFALLAREPRPQSLPRGHICPQSPIKRGIKVILIHLALFPVDRLVGPLMTHKTVNQNRFSRTKRKQYIEGHRRGLFTGTKALVDFLWFCQGHIKTQRVRTREALRQNPIMSFVVK